MSTSLVLGIDPGATGAIAVLDDTGTLLEIHDMPVTLEPNGRHAVNAPLLAAILAKTHARIAYCEFVGARPTDAKACGVQLRKRQGLHRGRRRRARAADQVLDPADLETLDWRSSRRRGERHSENDRHRPLACARRAFQPKKERRPRRGRLDRPGWAAAGGPPCHG